MCGIAGLVDPQRSPEALAEAAGRMADALAHRGPDGRGVWTEGPVALGHRRLSILDLSEAGAQPMLSGDGRWALSYNGELYDAAFHRPALAADGHAFRSTSDTEVLVELIARHGVGGALERVEGIFGLAAWDRAEGRLWLARDRMGVKPLFYAAEGPRLLFGSQLSALEACPGFSATVDPAALSSLLAHGYVPAPGAIFSGVRKLRPGHLLSWRPGEVPAESAYWRLDDAIEAGRADPFAGTQEEAADELERLLGAAVRRQMLSDVPPAAISATMVEESMPPERKAPSGTSLIILLRTAAPTSSRRPSRSSGSEAVSLGS